LKASWWEWMINGPFRSRDVSYVRNRKGPFTAFCVFIWQSSVDWYELAVTIAGLPDGILAYRKYQFLHIFEGLWKFWYILWPFVHLLNVMAIYGSCGHLVYIFPFWYAVQKKNPGKPGQLWSIVHTKRQSSLNKWVWSSPISILFHFFVYHSITPIFFHLNWQFVGNWIRPIGSK
jgi:hypothetical protein